MESNQTRIVQSKTAGYRKALYIQQEYICGLCLQHIDFDKAVLDHCHSSGRIRAVLHRSCNSLLGKIENNFRRFGITLDQLQCIAPTAYDYIHKDYNHMPYHYTHRVKARTKSKAKPRVKPKP